MRNTVIILLSGIVLMSSCDRQPQRQGSVAAQQTADKVRANWVKTQRLVKILLEDLNGKQLSLPQIGVYAFMNEATEVEREAFKGVPFVRNGSEYLSPGRPAVTADTTAVFFVCFPCRQGLTDTDTVRMKAPFGENLYGTETSRSIGDAISVRMALRSSMTLLRIVCESEDVKDKLTKLVVGGENIATEALYQPYIGKWGEVMATGYLSADDADCLLNNGRQHDFYLIPTRTSGEATLVTGINGKDHVLKATLPPMSAGSLTRLNLRKGKDGMAVSSSWVETERPIAPPCYERVDSVRTGHYLQADGSITMKRNEASIAVVIETDGRHGKAVALADCKGRYCFSTKGLSGGRMFPTIDGKRKEGIVNPRQEDGIDEEDKIIFKPDMPYGDRCALGCPDGAGLTQKLLDRQRNGDIPNGNLAGFSTGKEMLAEVKKHPGSYVPSLAEMAQLHFYQRTLGKETGCEPLSGEYLTCTESSERTFYLIDMGNGIITGTPSKRYLGLRLRLFHLF